jgi:ligand-binding sensor domain-containing protein
MRRILTLIIAMTTLFIFQTNTSAIMNFSLDANPGLAGNSMGDIVYDGKYIWVGTGDGLSYSPDSGKTWSTYNSTNGLNANDISALAVFDSTLWVACAYTKMVGGEPIPYGRGFNKTTDRGKTWKSYIPAQVDFAGEIVYDIAFDDSSVWAACWYGGLIHSGIDHDTLKWENVFVNDAAKEDYEDENYAYLNNRFFSVVVDTFCPNDKKLKNSIRDIVFDGRFLWVATQNGLHAIDPDKDTLTYLTFDTSSGLNANGVYSLTGYTSFSDTDTTSFLCVGAYTGEKKYELPLQDSLTGEGFNYTSDYGFTWDTSLTEQATDLEKFAYNIVIADTVAWSACGKGGLIRSFNRGKTWENVFVDTSAERRYDEGNLLNKDIFISVAVDTFSQDTTIIWTGTANGLYKFIYTISDSAQTVIHYLYQETGNPFQVVSIGIQQYDLHTVVWASACSLRNYGPWPPADPYDYITCKSTDGGETWVSEPYLASVWVRDFAFQGSTIWAATDHGLKRMKNGDRETFEIVDTLNHRIIPSNFTSVCIVNSTLWAGTVDGLVKSKDDGKTWQVIKFAQSFKKAIWAGTAAGIYKFIYNYRDVFDTVLNYNSYYNNITGDFVVSTAIQKYKDRKTIWAGTQPAYSGGYGASISTNDGDSWSVTLDGDRVWNFAFDDSVVWAATSSGLKRSYDGGGSWDVFNYMKDKDEITKDGIFSTEFTSVAIIDDEVWAGNADGLVRASKDVKVGEDTVWSVFRTSVPIGEKGSETAYAYPSPFSPMLSTGGVVRIHYKPQKDGPVTIKIYDFAMNLVTTLRDEKSAVGIDQDKEWDGKNDKGDMVANGVYFFKVEAPGGQTEWGKLVILK